MATAFSDEQDVELLAVLERTILLAAAARSAVSSTIETIFERPYGVYKRRYKKRLRSIRPQARSALRAVEKNPIIGSMPAILNQTENESTCL
jgi:hypothetical protein